MLKNEKIEWEEEKEDIKWSNPDCELFQLDVGGITEGFKVSK